MRGRKLVSWLVGGVCCASVFGAGCSVAQPQAGESGSALRAPDQMYLFSPEDLERAAELVASGNEALVHAREAVIAEAEVALAEPIVTVVDGKEGGKFTAPSGDPRDYVSLSPYWWPDPEKEDGLPFIRRDGEINPDRDKYDANKLGDFGENVRKLAMGYQVTGDERFAERAAAHLRAWFVTPETRMVPRIQFGQFVPGRSEGRKGGIIETNRIRFVADAVEMIKSSPAWTESDDAGVRQWYGEYAQWLMTSKHGKDERASENNHGTWCHTQIAQYALFSGDTELAAEIVQEGFVRIRDQIEPDGRQPHELERTMAADYSCFNLRALTDMGIYAEKVGVDLLSYETDDGRSIRQGIEFMVPYVTGHEEWPYQQIKPTRVNMYNQLFRMATLNIPGADFSEAIEDLPELEPKDQWMAYFWPVED